VCHIQNDRPNACAIFDLRLHHTQQRASFFCISRAQMQMSMLLGAKSEKAGPANEEYWTCVCTACSGGRTCPEAGLVGYAMQRQIGQRQLCILPFCIVRAHRPLQRVLPQIQAMIAWSTVVDYALTHSSSRISVMITHARDTQQRCLMQMPRFVLVVSGLQWLEIPREYPAILHMLSDLANVLRCLHTAGFVHRDLKPGNALWMLHSQTWRLIDFGISAAAGVTTHFHSGPFISIGQLGLKSCILISVGCTLPANCCCKE
jgi:hypothetical protein